MILRLQLQGCESVLFAATADLLTESGTVNQGKQASGARQPIGVVLHGPANQIVLGAIVVDDGEGDGQRAIDSAAVHVTQ